MTATIPDAAIQSAGYYRLLYFTRDSDSILGMSDAILVEEGNDPREPLDW